MMKSGHNYPLNWELIQPIIEEFSKSRNMIFQFEQFGNKYAVKILKPGSPIRIDLHQTKTGITIVSNIGRDLIANQDLIDYIEEEVGHGRLHEERIVFRKVTQESQLEVKKILQDYCNVNEVPIFTENNLSNIVLKDPLIDNTVKIDFYDKGTIYMYGFNTPLFDEIHNLVYSQTKVLPTVQFPLLSDVLRLAKNSIENDDLEDCKICKHLKHCNSKGNRMLNIAHFERSISTYPCQRVINTYVCRYIHRYSSEITNLIEFNKSYFSSLDKLKILSLGCGASPDFLAFKYFFENKKIEYIGIDYNKKWSQFHNFYQNQKDNQDDIKYFYQDFFEIIDKLNKKNNLLDFNAVIMSYVVSTISTNHDTEEILDLFIKINLRILKFMQPDSLFIINDINNKELFVDIMETIIEKIDFSSYEVEKYFHSGSNRRYMSNGKVINDSMIRFFINKDVVKEYNSQLECNSAAFIFRRKI